MASTKPCNTCGTNDHHTWDEEFSIFLAMDVRAYGELQREITEDIEIELIPLAIEAIATNNGDH